MISKGVNPNKKWEQIKDDLETQIIKGDLTTGYTIPSISKLALHYKVSKTTIQKALTDMMSDKTIDSRKGVGYFVFSYTKELLTDKHKLILRGMIDKCIEYAKSIDIEHEKLEDFRKQLHISYKVKEDLPNKLASTAPISNLK